MCAISVLMTAIALLGFSISTRFYMLCLWAIPYGLGAGAIDAALNNYVALNYASKHMSWLHCFWGVGATISPYIMGFFLTGTRGWSAGYHTVGIIQIVITALLFMSLPLWKKRGNPTEERIKTASLSIKNILKIKGVPFVLVSFFCYCALETTTGLWASSYLVKYHNIDVETAARFASLFYIGITFGRFLNGFVADKIKDKHLIRAGIIIVICGIILLGIPGGSSIRVLIGLVIIGLGCAPVYPCIIHSTPNNFGKENSQAVIGVQMASAYLGSTFMPPLFGVIADKISIGIYPIYLIFFGATLLIMSELLNKKVVKQN